MKMICMFIQYKTCGVFRNYLHFEFLLVRLYLESNLKCLLVQYLRQTLKLTFEEGVQMLKVMMMFLCSEKKKKG